MAGKRAISTYLSLINIAAEAFANRVAAESAMATRDTTQQITQVLFIFGPNLKLE